MSKSYYILGSGGFAKEVFFLAESTLDRDFQFKGFIDLKPEHGSEPIRGRNEAVVDEEDFLKETDPNDEIYLFMGIGKPELLSTLSARFEGYKFPNLIAANSTFDNRSVEMGRGNIITSNCVLTVDITIGSFNIFNLQTTVGHDVIVGSCNVFNPGTNISGGVHMGSGNLFGTNSTVLENVNIGSKNVLGASALANKEIEDNSVMVGVPAKKLSK